MASQSGSGATTLSNSNQLPSFLHASKPTDFRMQIRFHSAQIALGVAQIDLAL